MMILPFMGAHKSHMAVLRIAVNLDASPRNDYASREHTEVKGYRIFPPFLRILSGSSLPGPSFNKSKNFWHCNTSFSSPAPRILMRISLQALPHGLTAQVSRLWIEVFKYKFLEGGEREGIQIKKGLSALPFHFIQRHFARDNEFWVSVNLHNPATHYQAA